MGRTERTPRVVTILLAAFALTAAGLGAGVGSGTAAAQTNSTPPSGASSPATTPATTPALPTTKQPFERTQPKITKTQSTPKIASPSTPPAAPQRATPQATGTAVPVIIDSDIFGSADDAGALAIANAMQDNGQITILGVVVNYASRWGAPAVDAIDTYYGHGNIPVGTIKPVDDSVSSPDYAQFLAQNFPNSVKDGNNAPEAVALYRKLLAGAADHSVVIVAIGLETNLANLLNSGADGSSSLNGKDLVAQKVKMLSMMGGEFPKSGQPEYNWAVDASSATQVVNNWAGAAHFSGYEVGQNILTGAGLANTPTSNPVRVAFERMIGAGKNMSSWDETAMYYGGLGADGLVKDSSPGSALVASDGSNTWNTNNVKNQFYSVEAVSPDTIAASLEKLMDQLPSSTTAGDPVDAYYQKLGGANSYLGSPKAAEYTTPGGLARDYQGGSIYWSNASGAHVVQGAILAHYVALGGPGSLGYPTVDESGTPDGIGRYNHFNAAYGVSIYWTPNTGAHEIQGAIRAKWASMGWETGLTGYPVTDESGTPDGIGRYNHFSASYGASIYWTPNTDAHEIQGAIRAKWASMGWETGPTGYPVTDESGTPDGIGRYNHFSASYGASIYWTPNTGAQEIQGAIQGRWASMGWETSQLGYPTSDEYGISGGRRNDFEHGWIDYSFSSGQTHVGAY